MRPRYLQAITFPWCPGILNAALAEGGETAAKKRYRILAMKYHPDKHPKSMEKNATQAITRINRAYEILKE
jgi:preprotein translocase subunit Sec63